MPRSTPPVPALAPTLRQAYQLMRRRHGHQHWWPGESPFEVCIGAILTQNTAWRNVELALQRLRSQNLLSPHALHSLTPDRLADLIRPAGYPRVKARRLLEFLHVLVREHGGSLQSLFQGELADVRARLLRIHGIGPETADCLLLYAGNHPSFVIDAYTRRIFARHGWCSPQASYPTLQQLCTAALKHLPPARRLDYWQDYHAQLVAVGKLYCRPRDPHCHACPLQPLLLKPQQPTRANRRARRSPP